MLGAMATPDITAFERGDTITTDDGLDLAVYDLGGDGPDILLVHATGFCAGVWAPIAARLDGFRVAAIDVRGHGRSDAPDLSTDDAMSWQGTGADVLAAVDALGLVDPFGVGHSMGGASLLIAELERPSTFRGLWVFEPIVMPPTFTARSGANPLAEGARRRRAEFASARDAFDNYASKPPFDVLDPDALAAYVRDGFATGPDGSVTLRCRPEVEAATFEMGPEHHTFERLGELDVTVTVARGRMEPGPAVFAPAIVDALADGRIEEHPDLGHFGPLQDPAAIAASIRSAAKAAPPT